MIDINALFIEALLRIRDSSKEKICRKVSLRKTGMSQKSIGLQTEPIGLRFSDSPVSSP